jgi:peptide/nickel transport system substrate-binding protein
VQVRIPAQNQIENAVRTFTFSEKLLFYLLAIIFAFSAFFMIWKVDQAFMVEIPARGGTISEGVLGYPRYINPLLPITDAGRDLTNLIYSGLLKPSANGELIPDLAREYAISEDGLIYTFILKDDVYFHDGTKVTADDVIFTIEKATDPQLKSPKSANWAGVSVTKVDEKTVEFKLNKPYAPFLQNTTLGILPKHLWQNTSADEFSFTNYNIEPIGSGPYKIKNIKRDEAGLPEYYHLVPFTKYIGGIPNIKDIYIYFYTNEKSLLDAYESGIITSINSISPETAKFLDQSGAHIETIPLPRVFGVFFNQNSAPVFSNLEVRQALNIASDRKEIVNSVLNSYGTQIDGPLPKDTLSGETGMRQTELSTEERIAQAKKILTDKGWALNEEGVMVKKTKKETVTLSFSISTANTNDLSETAELLKSQWEKIGAKVSIKLYDIGDLNQNVIRPRKYDALLFGEVVGRDLDLFGFWHSSQRNDPGLNISMYTNSKADKFLEEARTESDPITRMEAYYKFEDEFYKDLPAIFLYSPLFIYVVPEELKGLSLGDLTVPADRFLDVESWYLNTDKVWKIFINNN